MEESKFLVDIVFGVLGSVLMTFFIFWFVGVNKAQKEHESKINDGMRWMIKAPSCCQMLSPGVNESRANMLINNMARIQRILGTQ